MKELLRRWSLALMASALLACSAHLVGGRGDSDDAGSGEGGADTGGACTRGTLVAADYDQSCVADADCAPVFEGNLCQDCRCPNAVVNQQALPAYTSAILAGSPVANPCHCPFVSVPVCMAGACVLPQP